MNEQEFYDACQSGPDYGKVSQTTSRSPSYTDMSQEELTRQINQRASALAQNRPDRSTSEQVPESILVLRKVLEVHFQVLNELRDRLESQLSPSEKNIGRDCPAGNVKSEREFSCTRKYVQNVTNDLGAATHMVNDIIDRMDL